MSVVSVVKRDFLDVRRAKLVWAPAALYVLFMLLFYWGQSTEPDPDFEMILWSLAGLGGALVVPLVALVAAYLSIAGERESGSIKYQLSLPVSRTDFLIGKLLSRSAVVTVALIASFAVGVVAARVLVPEMDVAYGTYAAFAGLTVLYALAYVAVAVSLSAATASRSRAMGAAIGYFFVFNLVWNFLPIGPTRMIRFVFDELGIEYSETLIDFVYSVSPTGAYLNSTQLVFSEEFLETMLDGAPQASDPFYVQPWFMPVILAIWIVVPLVLGRWRFRRADLG